MNSLKDDQPVLTNQPKKDAFTQEAQIQTSVTFKYNWYTWRILGIHPPKKFKYIYYLYSIILNITITTLYPVTLVVQVFKGDNLKQILEAMTLTVSNVTNSIKQFNSLIYRKECLSINEILDTLDARAKGESERKMLKSMMRNSYRVQFVYYAFYTSTAIVSEIATIFASPRRLMYPAWFPFDWRASEFKFLVVHVYQCIGIIVGAIQDACNDTYPALCMATLTAHMKTLMVRIRSLGMDSAKSAEENYNDLVACIKDYQLLNRYFQILQKITSNTLLMQILATGLVACITGVYVFFASTYIVDMLYLCMYFMAVVMEILVSCIYGNELMYKSRYMTEAIYNCNWTDQDRKFKQALIIFMQSTQNDMEMKAGGLVVVNLESFMSVIKTSYSYFAVLLKLT